METLKQRKASLARTLYSSLASVLPTVSESDAQASRFRAPRPAVRVTSFGPFGGINSLASSSSRSFRSSRYGESSGAWAARTQGSFTAASSVHTFDATKPGATGSYVAPPPSVQAWALDGASPIADEFCLDTFNMSSINVSHVDTSVRIATEGSWLASTPVPAADQGESSCRVNTEVCTDRASTVSPSDASDTLDASNGDSDGLIVGALRVSSPLAHLNTSSSSAQFRSLAPPNSLMSPGPDMRDGFSTFFSPRAVLTAGLRKRYAETLHAASASEPVELDESGGVLHETK